MREGSDEQREKTLNPVAVERNDILYNRCMRYLTFVAQNNNNNNKNNESNL